MWRYLRTGVRLPSPPYAVPVTDTKWCPFLLARTRRGWVNRFGSRASGFSDVEYDIFLMMYMAVPIYVAVLMSPEQPPCNRLPLRPDCLSSSVRHRRRCDSVSFKMYHLLITLPFFQEQLRQMHFRLQTTVFFEQTYHAYQNINNHPYHKWLINRSLLAPVFLILLIRTYIPYKNISSYKVLLV